MNKTLLIIIITTLSACTFKGEINDNRSGGNEPTGLEKSENPKNDGSEASAFLDLYAFNQVLGSEMERRWTVVEDGSGELAFEEPLFLPPESTTFRLDFRSAELKGFKARSVNLLDAEGVSVSGIRTLKGSGEKDLEFEAEGSVVSGSGARYFSVLVGDDEGVEKTVLGDVFVSPTDIEISFVSPTSATQRDASKDIFREDGSFFFVHQLLIHNAHPYPVEIKMPTVFTGQYLVRRFEDVMIPHEAARNIDRKNCGGAVSVGTDFTESPLPLLGLYLVPATIQGEAFKEFVAQSQSVQTLAAGASKSFNVFVRGSGDLEIINSIFSGYSQSNQRYMSGCIQKREWFDPERGGRHDSGKFGEEEPIQTMGMWVYFGEPQYSEHTFRKGISRVFLNFADSRNQSVKIRPVGGYEGTMLERVPLSLETQKLLFTLGVE